ncbi:MAG: PAS domain-containing protein, partial [Betaproteobacteria bacterium]
MDLDAAREFQPHGENVRARAAAARSEFSDARWRSLQFFNAYRIAVAILMLLSVSLFGADSFIGWRHRTMFVYGSLLYLAFAVVCCFPARIRRPALDWQLTLQVAADVVFIVVLMHASGGVVSGMGLLLLAVLAGAGMISRGRLTLFHAALASIGVLLQHTYQVLGDEASVTQYVHAGFLSIGYFATAWVAHVLARYTTESERLAAQREVDLANMAEVNQLVIQDMDAGVLVVDADGRIRSRNAKAEALLGPIDDQAVEASLRERAPVLAGRISRWRESFPGAIDPLTTLIAGKPVSVRFVPVGRHGNVGAV